MQARTYRLTPLHKLPLALVSVLASSLAMSALASPFTGEYFYHQDWEVACDNTGTCRMVGYSAEFDTSSPPVSLLLLQEAGANGELSGTVTFGDPETVYDAEGYPIERQGSSVYRDLRLWLNGRDLGVLPTYAGIGIYRLNERQAQAVVQALRGTAVIELRSGSERWRVSDKGSTAVLLKVDEYQNRLNTPSALLRRGTQNNQKVFAAQPAPIVRIPDTAKQPQSKPGDAATFARLEQTLTARILPTLGQDADGYSECDALQEQGDFYADMQGWTISRLDTHHLLAQHLCWRAAYNEGIGMWVLDERRQYQPTLVTASAWGIEKGQIYASQKGRGVGDCWSLAQWSWNGTRFVPTLEASTGMCRGFAGGAWSLPTLVAEVQ